MQIEIAHGAGEPSPVTPEQIESSFKVAALVADALNHRDAPVRRHQIGAVTKNGAVDIVTRDAPGFTYP